MSPIKLHRTVRSGAVGVNGGDRCGAAIESAENEGWPAEVSQGKGMRVAGTRHGLDGEPVEKLPLRRIR